MLKLVKNKTTNKITAQDMFNTLRHFPVTPRYFVLSMVLQNRHVTATPVLPHFDTYLFPCTVTSSVNILGEQHMSSRETIQKLNQMYKWQSDF